MLKALFLDMDETLCNTTLANTEAQRLLAEGLNSEFGSEISGEQFSQAFLKGIYKQWTEEQREHYQPLREQYGELIYRQQLAKDLLAIQGVESNESYATQLHEQFERDRMHAFDFFPTIKEWLVDMRTRFTLVVITNGPEFSQIPKLRAVNMENYVDHILIGGQEPEEKPAASIFEKAMRLANCSANETIHFGDSLSADIAGANSVGIPSVWIQHGQELDGNSAAVPTTTLTSPIEIPLFVSQLNN